MDKAQVAQILDKQREEKAVPPKATSIGVNDKGEMVYVLHKDDEDAQTSRDRVKPEHVDYSWIDFEPANPGFTEELATEKEPKRVIQDSDIEDESEHGDKPKDEEAIEAAKVKESTTSEDTIITPKKKKVNPYESNRAQEGIPDAGDRNDMTFSNNVKSFMNANPIERAKKGLYNEEKGETTT